MTARSLDDKALADFREALVSARRMNARGEHTAARAAVGASFNLLGAMYAQLDPSAHPVVTRRLQAVYDSCLALLGEACLGDVDALDRAIALVTPMRGAARATATDPTAKLRLSWSRDLSPMPAANI